MQTKRQLQPVVAAALVLLAANIWGSIVLAATLPPPTHTHYWFTTINIKGGFFPAADGINDQRLVSGYYADSTGLGHGFLWHNGTVVAPVDAPGAANTYLGEVNNVGVVIGNDGDATVSHAVLYSVRDHTWTQLPDIEGKPINLGNGINSRGIAVGSAFEGTFTDSLNGVGWIWDGSAYSSFFSVPQASGYGTYASEINDLGRICGEYTDSKGASHGFFKQDSHISTIDVPGADDTLALGINDQDEVVGVYYVGAVFDGFIMRAGNFVTVDVPGAASTWIYDINNHGDLCGFYIDTSGIGHGFIATPIGSKD